MRSGGVVYYLLQDHLNSTARIVNSAGTIQTTIYYFPFGGLRGGSHSSLTTKRFTGLLFNPLKRLRPGQASPRERRVRLRPRR
jgi:hypothetical protein